MGLELGLVKEEFEIPSLAERLAATLELGGLIHHTSYVEMNVHPCAIAVAEREAGVEVMDADYIYADTWWDGVRYRQHCMLCSMRLLKYVRFDAAQLAMNS